jgi:hypothetical protein
MLRLQRIDRFDRLVAERITDCYPSVTTKRNDLCVLYLYLYESIDEHHGRFYAGSEPGRFPNTDGCLPYVWDKLASTE